MKKKRKTIKLIFPLSTHINITWFKPFTLRLWSVTRARGHEQVLFIGVSARTFLPEVCMGFSSVRPPANLSPTGLKYSFGWIKSRPAALITGAKRTLKGSLQLTDSILFFILQKRGGRGNKLVKMKAISAVMNTTYAVVKRRPVRDLNPWPLRYRCSALPTELTSQLGTNYCVGSK